MLFRQNTHKTGNNAVEMRSKTWNVSQIQTCLHNYAFNVIQNWEMDALQFIIINLIYSMVLTLLAVSVMVEEDESSRLRIAN